MFPDVIDSCIVHS